MDSLYVRTSISVSSNLETRPTTSQFSAGRPVAVSAAGGGASESGGGAMRTALSRFSFKHPFRSLFPGAKQGVGIKGVALDDAVSVDVKESKTKQGDGGGNSEQSEGQNGNWVLKVLHVKSLWSEQGNELREEIQKEENESSEDDHGSSSCGEFEACDCEYDDEEEEEIVFDKSSFSELLKKVSVAEAKLYARMSNLGSLAYDIPNIKPRKLLRRHGLRYATSSIEKRELLANAVPDQPSKKAQERKTKPLESDKNQGPRISASAAFHTVASAAAYLNSHTRSIFVSSKSDSGQEMLKDDIDIDNIGDMASFMATTDSVTSVVAAKEEVKQAVADDLNSVSSAPCEWYICDDDQTATRFFVIQGSETLASWQANLLFEPIQFEGTEIMVHRGIYEAAKGMYQQMLPEIRAHTKAHGTHAKLRFTGHSLGGSLSLLINLMLLIRGEAPLSSLLPVITFGAPTVMCGGDELLRKLGLPKSHVQAVTMHRDIVPRAFSCNYPDHVAKILKAVNGNFRNHPCLNNLKLLFAPMGELIILQPDNNYSPQHHLLPSGSGLYHLTTATTTANPRLIRSAKLAFLNSPHPLQILADRSAYGNSGTIQRDHDMSSYLRCVRSVIRHDLAQLRQRRREKRRDTWRSLLVPRVGVVGESVERFSRHVHLLVLLLFPARWLLVGAYGVLDGFVFQ